MEEHEYLSVTEYSALHNLDVGSVRKYIATGRIAAIKIGNQWAIRAGTPRPSDNRVRTGKYRGFRNKAES